MAVERSDGDLVFGTVPRRRRGFAPPRTPQQMNNLDAANLRAQAAELEKQAAAHEGNLIAQGETADALVAQLRHEAMLLKQKAERLEQSQPAEPDNKASNKTLLGKVLDFVDFVDKQKNPVGRIKKRALATSPAAGHLSESAPSNVTRLPSRLPHATPAAAVRARRPAA